MESISYIERTTGKIEQEKVYGGQALRFLYNPKGSFRFLAVALQQIVSKLPFVSRLYGWWQHQSLSRSKVLPFIENYHVDTSEFAKDPAKYTSFNDFFVRKLKPESRPITSGNNTAIIPADGRYRFYQNLSEVDGFLIKGQRFSLEELLHSKSLASQYESGSMLIARLCPTDYHRFHFPCDCTPSIPELINGYLYSVNPIALRRNIHIFTQNKRMITRLNTKAFGKVLYIEVGATNVGTIHQTYNPNEPCQKGDEKGYFSFGGSALILLFEKEQIQFEDDLLELSKQGLEIRCLMGQPLVSSPISFSV